ncbi:MAG: DUF2924 domain-containing protein [Pseudomonadota bacterium]
MSTLDQSRDLRRQWRTLTGQDAPKGLSGKLLAAALSYEEQHQTAVAAERQGLTLTDRKHLRAIARGGIAGSRDCNPKDRACLKSKMERPSDGLSLGTQFVRAWQGQDQVVTVVEGGFLWNGTVYGSLSAAARAITGTRWNGRRFFGLSNKPTSPLSGKAKADG